MIYHFLPFIILIGLITSYQDIRFHKIKNIWVIYAIFVSIILNFVFLIKDFNINYYSQFLTNLILIIIVCIILWIYGFWPAGDAKLIIAYSFLLPITVYSLNWVDYFSSIFLLINIFVPYTLFYFVYFIFCETSKIKLVFNKINYKNLLNSIFAIFFIMWPISYVSSKFLFLNNLFVKIILIIICFYLLDSFIKKIFNNSIFIYFVLFVLRIIFQFEHLNLIIVKNFLIYFVLFLFIRLFIIEIANLMSEEKVNKNGEIVLVKKYLPFAPFAFLGVILTILSGGMFINILIFLLNLVG
tara:strand:+ start:1218 stop:2111 length:894 start_codon:yes stop_codon:yes gene_type:complete